MRRRFGVEYALAVLDLLLHRLGWSLQVPARKATERDPDAQICRRNGAPQPSPEEHGLLSLGALAPNRRQYP
ncbi:winged helix-turn-helix domain-containing protein [Streptomyces sp. NPDC002668]|uniref:helix-turn-helix domain-containing protein n=1 Tax=Streptomyces sp. NPDC002668 TaxID=3154422 RepID=UPI00332215AF